MCSGSVEIVDSDGDTVALQGADAPHGYDTDDYLNLVITPEDPLTIGETYTVTIQDIEDSYHYVMDTYTWSFTVGDPAPALTVSATPNLLWPPNHKYRDVATSVTVFDVCDETPTVELVSLQAMNLMTHRDGRR
jgi:hypothetical protein